jgi:hypothetical protein
MLPSFARRLPGLAGSAASALVLTVGPVAAPAAEHVLIAKSDEQKAAEKVVVSYLDLALRHDWASATKLVEPASLAGVKDGWLERAERAPTIDDEMRIVRSVGKESLDEVRAMPPAEFYAAYHAALAQRFNLTEARIKSIADSLKLRVLAIAMETDSLVHVLVRTTHADEDRHVSKLELVSLVKAGDRWLVSLDEQGPKVTRGGEG